jgi:hypothetical protein
MSEHDADSQFGIGVALIYKPFFTSKIMAGGKRDA